MKRESNPRRADRRWFKKKGEYLETAWVAELKARTNIGWALYHFTVLSSTSLVRNMVFNVECQRSTIATMLCV